MTPAKTLVSKFGGVRRCARAIRVSPAAVSRWQTSKKGFVPSKYHRQILTAAKQLRLGLRPEQLVDW